MTWPSTTRRTSPTPSGCQKSGPQSTLPRGGVHSHSPARAARIPYSSCGVGSVLDGRVPTPASLRLRVAYRDGSGRRRSREEGLALYWSVCTERVDRPASSSSCRLWCPSSLRGLSFLLPLSVCLPFSPHAQPTPPATSLPLLVTRVSLALSPRLPLLKKKTNVYQGGRRPA